MSFHTVLVVNEDVGTRNTWATWLSDEGFLTIAAGDPVEALRVASGTPPGVALLDAAATDGQTTNLISDLHALDPDWICAVVTQDQSLDAALSALEMGAFQCIRTPVSNAELLNRLRLLFDVATLRAENRKLAEALRVSEARFDAVLESVGDAVFIKDGALRYASLNTAAESYLGHLAGGVIGRTEAEVMGPFWARAVEELDRRVLAGETIEEEIVSTRGGAEHYDFVSRRPVVDAAGQITGVLGVVRDVTEKKMLERKLVQAQKMEAMGVLSGGIAHDFNNILGAIVGHVELAILGETRGKSAALHLEEVRKATSRASGLVKQILAFTRQGDQESRPVEVAPIVRECMQLIRAALPTTITIETELDEVPCSVMANPTHIHQIIMNLATNAGHAMKNGRGRLRISLAAGEDTGAGPDEVPVAGPFVEISVSDDGCGMSPVTVKNIFNPYFTTKAEGVGTGLGLALVKDILDRTGGTVSVSSRVDEGTVVRVRLPRIAAETEAQVSVDHPMPRGSECILYVDDEETLVEIGQNLFEKLGYTVIGKTNPVDALAAFVARSRDIDIILTDQTMPEMTGVELAKAARAIRDDIPVLICSGFAEAPEYQSMLSRRDIGFLSKPIILRELAAAVRRSLDSGKNDKSAAPS